MLPFLAMILRQQKHSQQGSLVGPCLQLSPISMILAMVVLPVPLSP
jgi:hypothetical protein